MKKHNKRNTLIVLGVISMVIVILLLQVVLAKEVIRQKPPQPAPPEEMEVAVEIVKAQPVKQKIAKAKPVASPKSEDAKAVKPAAKGALPPVSANYRKYIGFKRYSEEMTKRGAKFLIFGGSAKRLYELDIRPRTLVRTDINKLVKGNYSSRSRVIVDEPALNHYLKLAKTQHGISDPEVHLLVPRDLENRIANELRRQNISLNNISGFKGFYAYSGQGKLTLRLNQALTDRGVVRLDLAVEL